MSKVNFSEIIISGFLIFLMALLFWERDLLMPSNLSMMLILSFVVVFAMFAALLFKENARDERETLHRFIAARSAYFTGTCVLVLGIVVQSLDHAIDIWLIITLTLMILAKIVGSIYGRLKH
jgi:hypothetical protein